MNKKALGALVGIAIIIILIALIYSNQRSESQLKIGVILPLSGDSAYYGQQAKNGMEMAKIELKEKYPSFNFAIYYEDSAYNSTKGLEAYGKLNKFRDIDAVITLSDNISRSIQENSNKDRVIQVAIATSSPSFSVPNNYSFRTTPPIKSQISMLLNYLREKGYKKVGILSLDNEFGKAAKQAFEECISENSDIKIVAAEDFQLHEKDFKHYLYKLNLKNPQVILIAGTSSNGFDIMSDAKKSGIQAKFISLASIQTPIIINNTKVAEGLVYSYYSIVDQGFIETYKSKYNDAPDGYAAEGYEALNLIVSSYSRCNKKSGCAKNYLHNLKGYDSVFGNIAFDENGDVDYNFILKTVKNQSFIELESM